ncbi:PREDICTED: protein SCAR1-like isoform X2 [Lupinus angustifolius]|uniref:protein SCAR1-like isoform X2 n=1 Tax=Lupinus angustifolius TaxID=3871 RepID=UPI00092ED09A|nr:PREDICTED: protein SCAR1-like isoform X2 [Lupinus angustifolius]
MPLVRLQVRNEFSLGHPELYRETNREDPKAVLDGVAVAGLVGILRQLGDLADFAAEVFHGLQEQVMATASRSHRLMVRVQNIEASLTPLEKALLGQTRHIHFAYTTGCEWHPHMNAARNHFIYNDLPPFIMDSYEECRDPPRINFLDKFDIGGPGSCFKRYSDPTFFKKVSADSYEPYSENNQKARKTRKNKKRRSSQRSGVLLRGEQVHSSSGRMQFIPPAVNGRTSSSKAASATDMTVRSDVEDRSNLFDSKSGASYIECVFHPSNSMQSDEHDCKEPSPSRLAAKTNNFQSVSTLIDDSISHDSLEKHVASSSSGVTWDEKEEIVESTSQDYSRDKTPERPLEKLESDMPLDEAVTITNIDYNDIILDEESNLKSVSTSVKIDDIDSEPDNYMDALNSIESESEIDFDYEMEREVEQVTSHVTHGMIETRVAKATSNSFDNNLLDVVSQTGYTVSLNNETGSDFSEPHASNLGSLCPSDIPYSEGMTRDTVSLNKETFDYLPDSLQEIPPLTSEPYASNLRSPSPSNVPDRKEMTNDTVPLNKETFRNLPDLQQEISSLTSPPHASNLSSASPSDVPASKEIVNDIAYSHSIESPICEQAPQTCENSVVHHSVCTDSFIGLPTVHDMVSAPFETDIPSSGSKSSNLADEEAGRINSNICKYEETHRESSSDHSVSFWTNGGLLGLQPSKPPDFNISSSLSQGSLITKSEMDHSSSCNSMQKSNGYKEERNLSNEVAEKILKEPCSSCLTSSHNNDQPCTSAKNSGSSQLSNGIEQTERNTLEENVEIAPGCVLPAAPYMKALTEPNQGGCENSSRVFGLGHRLLTNSFQRKVSFDEKTSPYNSMKSIILERNEQNGIVKQPPPETTIKEKLGSGYPIGSLPPSPPLEHMKISFQPVSGLEISKLKLKFPDGSNHHGSIRDMFPSFQLVPELSIPLDDSSSHSDGNDTFCRSSHVSDGCLSPRSDNDSDQWESDETPESSDHGVYDCPHGRSSTEYVLCTKDCGGVSNDDTNVASGHSTYTTNGVEPSLFGPPLDFPSFDNVNLIYENESNKHSECNNVVTPHSHAEPTPPAPAPPPLPPMQWQVSKPQLGMTNGTHHFMSEDAEHINDHSLPESILFHQSMLAEFEQIHINHDDLEFQDNIIHKLKKQKLNGNKETNQLRMGKEVDEREDFLQQIRTKSINLRRTVRRKPNATTGPTASVEVTAILEKANAIRQVVASDDGEDDDNWSDT